ncbi:MAG: hypothetical protein IJS05_03615 [Paludibacteraceae bacterium]|nr:hypothetical protein [Paludibacteraceae bacterium]
MNEIFKLITPNGVEDFRILNENERKRWVIWNHIKISFFCIISDAAGLCLLYFLVVSFLHLFFNFSDMFFTYIYISVTLIVIFIHLVVVNIMEYKEHELEWAFDDIEEGVTIHYKRILFIKDSYWIIHILNFIFGFMLGRITYVAFANTNKTYCYCIIGVNNKKEMKCKCGNCKALIPIYRNTLNSKCPHCNYQNILYILQ